MWLPRRRLDDLGDGRSLGPLKERDDLRLLRAGADGDGLWCVGRRRGFRVRMRLRLPRAGDGAGRHRLDPGGFWSETTRIDLRVAEVPQPRPGDRIELGDEAFLIQGEPVRDRERLIWTVDLRPA